MPNPIIDIEETIETIFKKLVERNFRALLDKKAKVKSHNITPNKIAAL